MPQEPDPDYTDARKVIDELHQYVRNNMALWVQWFTFFITVNYVGIGWFAKDIAESGRLPHPVPVIYISIIFIVQCTLGIWCSLLLRRWFLNSGKELASRYRALPIPQEPPVLPIGFYGKAILLACLGVAALIVGWVCLAWESQSKNNSASSTCPTALICCSSTEFCGQRSR